MKFDSTGNDSIDAILSAVVDSSKECHNTQEWEDEAIDRIQDAADLAAKQQ